MEMAIISDLRLFARQWDLFPGIDGGAGSFFFENKVKFLPIPLIKKIAFPTLMVVLEDFFLKQGKSFTYYID